MSTSGFPENALRILAFKAASACARTIFRAGFAFTKSTFPKTMLLLSFLADLARIFKRATPGILKTPVFFNSEVVRLARDTSNFVATDFSKSQLVANAFGMLLLDMPLIACAFRCAISRSESKDRVLMEHGEAALRESKWLWIWAEDKLVSFRDF